MSRLECPTHHTGQIHGYSHLIYSGALPPQLQLAAEVELSVEFNNLQSAVWEVVLVALSTRGNNATRFNRKPESSRDLHTTWTCLQVCSYNSSLQQMQSTRFTYVSQYNWIQSIYVLSAN